jgi:LacI family transcriptional regulator
MARPRRESIPRRGAVRLKDVASAAGVSVSTASRALSGSGASDATVAAVLAASKRLGYRPDPVARAMRTRSTGLAGIVVPGISNPFFAELVESLEASLRSYRLEMILGDSCGSVEEEARRLETMVDRKVDGLIVIPVHFRASASAVRSAARAVPVVQVDRFVDGVAGDYVGLDNATGVGAALQHVVAHGCRDVVFVSDAGLTSTGRARLHAFQASVERTPGLSARRPLAGSYSLEFGREVVERLLRHGHLPDAIICAADIIALGVVRELRLRGVKVPDEVKVTGFDGILFGELSDPPLTTLRQPIGTIAAEAARLLDARLRGDASPAHRTEVAPILVVRQSSCAPSGGTS